MLCLSISWKQLNGVKQLDNISSNS